MTPFDHILKLYDEHPMMDSEADLEAHFRLGYVVTTPQAFAMARPVRKNWPKERLANPFDVEPLETADCWFIWALAGDLSVAARWLPRELPWLGFARRDRPARFVDAARVLKKAVASVGSGDKLSPVELCGS